MTDAIESKLILPVSNLASKRLNSFTLFAADSLLDKLFQAIAPLYCMEFLVKLMEFLVKEQPVCPPFKKYTG